MEKYAECPILTTLSGFKFNCHVPIKAQQEGAIVCCGECSRVNKCLLPEIPGVVYIEAINA